MSFFPRLRLSIWICVPLCSIAFIIWVNIVRVRPIDAFSRLAGGDALVADPHSVSGYGGGLRKTILPERATNSYQWIIQTQEMINRREWRLRHINYDNAPTGREVRTPSLNRWWLGTLAELHHLVSGDPIGQSVEKVAIWGNVVLHLVLLASATGFVAWRFGGWASTVTALGLAAFFPFASAFAGGQADDHSLSLTCIWWSLALLFTASRRAALTPIDRRGQARWFFLAGAVGALSLWANVAAEWPILVGIALGAFVQARLARAFSSPQADSTPEELPWRVWSLGGAAVTLIAYFLEFFPDKLGDWRVDAIHPLWGLAWIGLGELLARGTAWIQAGKLVSRPRDFAAVIVALAMVSTIPWCAVKTGAVSSLLRENSAEQLTQLQALAAENSVAWLQRDGLTSSAIATLLPVLLLGWALWKFTRVEPAKRAVLSLGLCTALVALGFAVSHLRWWATFDLTVIALLAAGVELERVRWIRSLWIGVFIFATGFGFTRLLPSSADDLTENEAEALITRDLGQWLANRKGENEPIVLSTPNLTASLIYHGGLRGLGTPFPDNIEGFTAGVRIAGALSPDDAQALVGRRKVTHIVIPSWDNYLDEYSRLANGGSEKSLINLLHRWLPPRWLRPVAYQVPKIPGFERSVVVFEVVELQENVDALSRIAEYFAEMGQLDQAAAAGQALARLFPDEPGAHLARAIVASACGNSAEFGDALKSLEPRLSEGFAATLPWDRQIGLAVVLTEAKRRTTSHEILRHCLVEMNETQLRSLTVVSLYRLQRLLKAYGEQIQDPRLRQLALDLLPPEIRASI